jgi:tetratricopeptide (TPR) repeat protein
MMLASAITRHTEYNLTRLLTYLIAVMVIVGCSTQRGAQETQTSGRESALFQGKFFAAQSEKAIGNQDKAYKLFQEALNISPDNHACMYELARLDFVNNNLPAAQDYVNRALALDPDNEWYHLFKADILIESGFMDDAAAEYKNILKLNSENLSARYELASVLIYLGDYQDAIKQYDIIEARSGITPELSMEKQRLYLELGKEGEALKELEKLIEAYPHEVTYQGMLAQYYLDNGDVPRALEIYESIREQDPGNGMLHLKLSEFYAIQGEEEKSYQEIKLAFEAIDVNVDQKVGILLNFYTASEFDNTQLVRAYELLEIMTVAHPTEAKSYAIYGDFQFRDHEIEKARENYRKAVNLDASRNIIWSQILQINASLSDFESLESESDRAMLLFPAFPEFYMFNGIANVQLKNYDKAISSLSVGKQLVFDNPGMLGQFYSSLGDSYHALEQHEKSDESYTKALELDPNNVFVLNNFSYYLSLREENLEKAAEMAKKANDIEPNQVSFEDTYAWVLFKQGKYEEAKLWLEKAMEHGGDAHGEIHEHLGDVLFKIGDEEGAVEQWVIAKDLGGASDLIDKKIADKTLYD